MGLVAILEIQTLFPYFVQWWNAWAIRSISQVFSFISLMSLWLTVSALPGDGSYLIAKRSIPEAVYNDIVLYEQYAAATYCNSNNDSPHTKLTCTANNASNCPLVEAVDTFTVAEFANSDVTDVTGYVAYDRNRNLTVVAFRGSRSIRNFLTDLDYHTNNTDLCTDCEAHEGFWKAWLEARDDILAAAKVAADVHPEYKLVVTGHSLGGALGTLCAAELRKMGYEAALYTYGSPRVGNGALAKFITNQAGGNYRVTHTNDPVPHFPLIAMGFQHVSPEFYIATGNNKAGSPAAVDRFVGYDDWAGNTGQLITNIESHLWYFNSVTGCGTGFEY